jgi:uncharacterized membrane protein YkoI
MIQKYRIAALSCAALGWSVALASAAFANDDRAEMASIARQAELITPERAVEIAKGRQAGVVTDVDLDHKRRGWTYEIEITDAQGKEWEVEIEGATGNVAKVKRDWF